MTSPLVPHLPTNLSQFLYLYEIWFSFRPPPTYMIDVIKYPVFFSWKASLTCRMAIIDAGEDEVDKMLGQLQNVDNIPLPRYFSEQLQISLFQQNCYI